MRRVVCRHGSDWSSGVATVSPRCWVSRGSRFPFSNVDHALVGFPIELCRHRVELVDSPGLGEHQVRTRRTVGFLNRADAIVLVLDATMLWSREEVHFLEMVLLPLGLKNIFFVINKWNLIEEMVLRPEDVETNIAGLESRIRQRVAPFCVVNSVDHSRERIFRVNALGALKARLRQPPSEASLAESNIPVFEQALQRFLVEERGRARNQITVGAMRAAQQEVNRYIDTQIKMDEQSIAQIEAQRQALQPQLERLRGIQKHIEGFLDSQSANLQDRLTISFDHQIKKIHDELPEAVKKFDLGEVMNRIMLLDVMTDRWKPEEDTFAKRLEKQLAPQVTRYLEQAFARWQQSVVRNELKAVSIDVEKHLQEEAAEYHRVLREIEERLGLPGETMEVRQVLQRWLAGGETGPVAGAGVLPDVGTGILADLTPLLALATVEIIADLMLHLTIVWLSLIGVVVTALRMYWRERQIRAEIHKNVAQALRQGLYELGHSRVAKMRNQVKGDFDRLKEKVTGSIVGEIALIDGSLQTIIERKKEQQFSTETERARLGRARRAIAEIIECVEKATAGQR